MEHTKRKSYGGNFVITPEQALSASYLRCIEEEIEVGRGNDLAKLDALRINKPQILTYKAKVLGGRDGYCEYADWTQSFIEKYGPRERCLSFGSGIGRVEDYLIRNGFCERLETIELCANENKAIRVENRHVETLAGDLNFVGLEPDSYDFILCHGVLHHLINIEYVLDQINLSLKEDGILLVYEYVGETRWQFNEARLSVLRENFPEVDFSSPPVWSIGGFESVRSGDLRSLIEAQFGTVCESSVDYGGIFFPFVTCTTPKADRYLAKVIDLDNELSQKEMLAPCYHMGVYRKSSAPPAVATPWSDEVVESNLSPVAPLPARIKKSFKKTHVGQICRTVKRHIMGRLAPH